MQYMCIYFFLLFFLKCSDSLDWQIRTFESSCLQYLLRFAMAGHFSAIAES